MTTARALPSTDRSIRSASPPPPSDPPAKTPGQPLVLGAEVVQQLRSAGRIANRLYEHLLDIRTPATLAAIQIGLGGVGRKKIKRAVFKLYRYGIVWQCIGRGRETHYIVNAELLYRTRRVKYPTTDLPPGVCARLTDYRIMRPIGPGCDDMFYYTAADDPC